MNYREMLEGFTSVRVLAILFLLVRGDSCLTPGSLIFAQTSVMQPPDEFVIRDVRIFDGARILENSQVWVQNGKIKAVGQELKAPKSVHTVEGNGETLLPGLIDSHVHVYGEALKEALVFGVTTEMDMFTSHEYALGIKREQAEGRDLDLADLRSAGTLVTAPHGHGTEYGIAIPTISAPAEARAFVDARIAEGSDYIKIIYDDGATYGISIPTINKETMAAVVTAAHKRGKLAVVHIGSQREAKDALVAGADGLAHLFVDSAPSADFAALVADHHAFVVPTMSVLASITHTPAGKTLVDDAHLQPYLVRSSLASLQGSFPTPHGRFAFVQETVRQLRARHVPILAGTDSPNPGTAHGASLHGELELLVLAGLSPTEALAAATSAPAAAFHLEDRGRIAPGMRADLLLVKGDPTADITATRNIVTVWKQGVEENRSAYRSAVEAARQVENAQKQAPAPQGSEGGLISDFEGGTPTTNFGAGWQISTDSVIGGQSSAQMHVVAGGAEGSKGALQIEGEVRQGTVTWAGAMFFPGVQPMSPANLSGKKTITFWTKGDGGSYRVMVYSQTNGYIPKMRAFVAGNEWTKISISLADFATDGLDLTGILFGTPSKSGHFVFMIDNVRME